MSEHKVSRREHMLLIGCFLALLVGVYLVTRFRAHRTRIVRAEQSIERDRNIIEGLPMPAIPAQQPDELAADLDALRRELAGIRSVLQGLEAGFASRSREPLGEIGLRLATLAAECGVELVSNVPAELPKVRALLAYLGLEGEATGSARTLRLRAIYPDLAALLARLGEIPGRVLPAAFALERPVGTRSPVLDCTFTLVVL